MTDDELDQWLNSLHAGLAEVVPSGGVPWPAEPLAALVDELAALPGAERLAARAWLPVELLAGVPHLATCAARTRGVAHALDDPRRYAITRPQARIHIAHLCRDLRLGVAGETGLHALAVELSDLLKEPSPHAHVAVRNLAHRLADRVRYELEGLLDRIVHRLRAAGSAPRLADAFAGAAEAHAAAERHEVADLEAALTEPIHRLVTAVTSMVGVDLAAADLDGVPLDGVRWSTETRWPPHWQDWVRHNSLRVAEGVFQIRRRGTGSRPPA
ncbi:hypothetical protein [Lentzea sp.]|uniref:hypothetical protein n=1 Tax=Lentzea sp. TaxID=56099 RepID=UPI002BB06FBD|nr:hypothetical protein [Lentzea sp.]HUQ58962.1 hypothetical protein [Lentzea sp.]